MSDYEFAYNQHNVTGLVHDDGTTKGSTQLRYYEHELY